MNEQTLREAAREMAARGGRKGGKVRAERQTPRHRKMLAMYAYLCLAAQSGSVPAKKFNTLTAAWQHRLLERFPSLTIA